MLMAGMELSEELSKLRQSKHRHHLNEYDSNAVDWYQYRIYYHHPELGCL